MKIFAWLLILIGTCIFVYTSYEIFVPLRFIPFIQFVEQFWVPYTLGFLCLVVGVLCNALAEDKLDF